MDFTPKMNKTKRKEGRKEGRSEFSEAQKRQTNKQTILLHRHFSFLFPFLCSLFPRIFQDQGSTPPNFSSFEWAR
jgi:hypothetical protein